MQAPGFILVFLALAGMFTKYNRVANSNKPILVRSLAAPIYMGNIIFIAGQTLGCAGTQWCLHNEIFTFL